MCACVCVSACLWKPAIILLRKTSAEWAFHCENSITACGRRESFVLRDARFLLLFLIWAWCMHIFIESNVVPDAFNFLSVRSVECVTLLSWNASFLWASGGRWLLIWQHAHKQTRWKKEGEKSRQTFLSQSSPCQPCKKAAKPIILSSSFFSGAAEASLDCHMYKGSPYKAIHGAEWTRHLWGFLISSSLFFSSFFQAL